jgi:hypothetical protein
VGFLLLLALWDTGSDQAHLHVPQEGRSHLLKSTDPSLGLAHVQGRLKAGDSLVSLPSFYVSLLSACLLCSHLELQEG